MIHDVIRAVAKAVRRAFPDRAVYLEVVEQGLEEPCFCISCARPAMRRYMGKRWRCSLPVTLHCFPGGDGERTELGEIFERLFSALELIECDGPLRGSNMHAGVRDGVGVFSVDYDFFTEWTEEAEQGPGVMLELRCSVQ